MKLKIIVAICLTALLTTSFKPDLKFDKAMLVGVWIYDKYEDEAVKYVKHKAFEKDVSGIKFKKNGELVRRQNVGWCGTPPITYSNYDGTWKVTSDSTLTIRYKYWGGDAEQDWLIKELSASVLKIKRLDYREYPPDKE